MTFNDKKLSCSDGIKEYNLGDKVEIVCVNASRQSSQIDFVLKEDYKVGFDYENYSE